MLEGGGFSVVGEAASGAEAIALAAELLPAVVLLDVQLPTLTASRSRNVCGPWNIRRR